MDKLRKTNLSNQLKFCLKIYYLSNLNGWITEASLGVSLK